jgi:hypothetical protein
MDNEVLAIPAAPVVGILIDTIIFAVFVTIVAGIIGCVTVLNALDSKSKSKSKAKAKAAA